MPDATASGSLLASEQRSTDLELAIARDPAAFRVLTGDRPTGSLHIGHYFGTLQNRVRLQGAGVERLVLIADYQVMTDRTAPAGLPADVIGQVADYLAVGSTRAGRRPSRTARSRSSTNCCCRSSAWSAWPTWAGIRRSRTRWRRPARRS